LKVAGSGGSPIDSGGNWQQVTHSHQVIGSRGEGEGPTNSGDSTMTSLAQAGDCLEPAEYLFHSFALLMAEQVAGRVLRRSIEERDL